MTTIIYDPETNALYADSLVVAGDTVTLTNQPKIMCRVIKGLGQCVIAAAGDPSYIYPALQWLEGTRDTRPDMKAEDFQALILDKDGDLFTVDGAVTEPFCEAVGIKTLGSGWEVALAAMTATGNPLTSMQVAKQLNIYTGGDTWIGSFDDEGGVYLRTADLSDERRYVAKKSFEEIQADMQAELQEGAEAYQKTEEIMAGGTI